MNYLIGCSIRIVDFTDLETGKKHENHGKQNSNKTVIDDVTIGVECDHCKKHIIG